MGMMEAVRLFFNRYTDFQGRSRRSEYWWVQLFFLIINIAVMVVMGVLGALGDVGMMLAGLVYIALLLFSLGCLIPGIAVGFRRLHDTDRTAWWLLIALVPLIGPIVLLVFFVMPGTVGPNTYGPDPKNPAAGAADVFS
ncbi:MAG: DUF805 domain-containing protein [Pseudomonadota bacterium]